MAPLRGAQPLNACLTCSAFPLQSSPQGGDKDIEINLFIIAYDCEFVPSVLRGLLRGSRHNHWRLPCGCQEGAMDEGEQFL